MYAESNGGNFCPKRRFSAPVEDLLGSAGYGGGVAISALVEPQAGLLSFLFLIEGTRPFTQKNPKFRCGTEPLFFNATESKKCSKGRHESKEKHPRQHHLGIRQD